MTKHNQTLEFKGLSKFQKTVMDISKKVQNFPPSVAGRQEFISFTAGQLHELQMTADLWRKYYRRDNFAEIIAICCKYFREQVKDDENEEV